MQVRFDAWRLRKGDEAGAAELTQAAQPGASGAQEANPSCSRGTIGNGLHSPAACA